jgi:hypothetical protein
LGLLGVRERVRELGGTVAIRSRPGEGTTVRISIPLSPEAGQRPRALDGARRPPVPPPDDGTAETDRAARLASRSYA